VSEVCSEAAWAGKLSLGFLGALPMGGALVGVAAAVAAAVGKSGSSKRALHLWILTLCLQSIGAGAVYFCANAYSDALCALRTAAALLASSANATAFATDDADGISVEDDCPALVQREYEQRTWSNILATVTLALCVGILVRKLGAKQVIRVVAAPQL